MSRRMKVTERVGGGVVVGSEGEVYSRRRTLRAAVMMVWEALTVVKTRLAPGWVRSRTSRRSLGRVNSWDFAVVGLVLAGEVFGNGEGRGVVSGWGGILLSLVGG